MRYKTIQDVPIGKLQKWLATAERTFGPTCATAKAYRKELQKRIVRQSRLGVKHGR